MLKNSYLNLHEPLIDNFSKTNEQIPLALFFYCFCLPLQPLPQKPKTAYWATVRMVLANTPIKKGMFIWENLKAVNSTATVSSFLTTKKPISGSSAMVAITGMVSIYTKIVIWSRVSGMTLPWLLLRQTMPSVVFTAIVPMVLAFYI